MSAASSLAAARVQLAEAEKMLRSRDGLIQFEEGLDLLQEAIAEGSADEQRLARNIGSTYATKVYSHVRRSIERDRSVPEPQLEHLFKLLLVFDDGDLDLPPDAREVKLALARHLLDRYLEGHAPQEKRAALEELMKIDKQRR